MPLSLINLSCSCLDWEEGSIQSFYSYLWLGIEPQLPAWETNALQTELCPFSGSVHLSMRGLWYQKHVKTCQWESQSSKVSKFAPPRGHISKYVMTAYSQSAVSVSSATPVDWLTQFTSHCNFMLLKAGILGCGNTLVGCVMYSICLCTTKSWYYLSTSTVTTHCSVYSYMTH